MLEQIDHDVDRSGILIAVAIHRDQIGPAGDAGTGGAAQFQILGRTPCGWTAGAISLDFVETKVADTGAGEGAGYARRY